MKREKKKTMWLFLGLLCIFFGTFGVQKAFADDSDSKKGIQGLEWIVKNDDTGFGVDHVLINVVVSDLISETETSWTPFTVNGKTYYYNNYFFEGVGKQFQMAKNNGVNHIHCVLMTRRMPGLTSAPERSGSAFYAFDTASQSGRNMVSKVFSIIASEWGSTVDYWILGNEVNDQHQYYEMGTESIDEYVTNYESALRMLNSAMTPYNKNAKVMVSLDHVWNWAAFGRFNAKDFVTKLAAQSRKNGDFNWGIAYHPYPEPLTSANFWDDGSPNCTNEESSAVITLYNIQVLTNYMHNSAMLYNNTVRPVTITEVGFTSAENGVQNETLQAAAICRAYYLAEANEDIDAFIIRSYLDNSAEIAQGYYFGLNTVDYFPKKAYYAYRNLNTRQGSLVSNQYLQYFGVSTWSELIPGYDKISFSKDAFVINASANKTSVKSGEQIQVKASAAGGTGEYEYKFMVLTGSNYQDQMILQDFSSKSEYSGKIRTNGASILVVAVKDKSGVIQTYEIRLADGGSASSYTGLDQYGSNYYYVENGRLNCSYKGLVYYKRYGNWYYVENGKVNKNYNSLSKKPGDNTWYKVTNGKLVMGYEGIVKYNGKSYYVQDSQLKWGVSGLINIKGTYYKLKNSIVDSECTTLLKIPSGEWCYFKQGVQNKTFSGVVQRTSTGNYYYVNKGVVDRSFTGLAKEDKKDGSYYYITNGVLVWGKTLIWKHTNNVKYYIQNSKLVWGEYDLTKVNDKYYYLYNSKVYTEATGIFYIDEMESKYYFYRGEQNTTTTGIVKGKSSWWGYGYDYNYLEKGKLNYDYRGLAYCPEDKAWYYIEYGRLNNTTCVTYYKGSHCYVQNGKFNSSKNGVVYTYYDKDEIRRYFYLKNGKIDSSYNGTVTYNGKKITFKNGIYREK